MKARLVLALLFALIELNCWPVALSSQDAGGVAMTFHPSARLSDREQNGLQGPVRSVVEERTYPAWTDAEGKVSPEFKSWNKTEYDQEGRIAATWSRDSSREHGLGAALYVTRYTYNATRLLLRMAREKDGELDGEIVYRYDDRGRLESITNSKDSGNPIAFHYGADGRKSKVAVAKPIDVPEGLGVMSYSFGYLFESGSGAPRLPGGGSAVTLYDEHDRPTEVQTRNANGEIVYRTLRVYDDHGHVLEEKQTMDDVLRIIPAVDQKKIMDQAGVSAHELRDQIARVVGGSETQSTKYTYDAQGRKTLTIQRAMGQMEERIETSYNEHGDVAKEMWQTTMSGTKDDEHDGSGSSERIYSYEYDSYGNWTVKKSSSRSLPDGTFKDDGDDVHRTIEYF